MNIIFLDDFIAEIIFLHHLVFLEFLLLCEFFSPSLTWRDMQHLVLRTANPTPLLNNAGWSFNGVGRRVSNKFGYGLMDAGALVKLARTWTTVPEQHMCTYEYSLDSPRWAFLYFLKE